MRPTLNGIDIEEDKVNTVSETYLEYGKDSKKSLIFVEGVRSIDETIASIKRHTRHQSGKIRFFKLHSGISEAARREIFTAKPAEDESFVIVSTSAGQSGITIPEVDLVLSNGLTKSKEIGEEGAEGLPPRLCTQAELMQQAGRGGRDIDGAKFVLARPISYDKIYLPDELKGFYDIASREQHIPPEIYHTNIIRLIGINTISQVDVIVSTTAVINLSGFQKSIVFGKKVICCIGADKFLEQFLWLMPGSKATTRDGGCHGR